MSNRAIPWKISHFWLMPPKKVKTGSCMCTFRTWNKSAHSFLSDHFEGSDSPTSARTKRKREISKVGLWEDKEVWLIRFCWIFLGLPDFIMKKQPNERREIELKMVCSVLTMCWKSRNARYITIDVLYN